MTIIPPASITRAAAFKLRPTARIFFPSISTSPFAKSPTCGSWSDDFLESHARGAGFFGAQHTPAHSDACIAGLKESGRRAVYTYSPGLGPGSQYPRDLLRLQAQYFSSADQLLTLELNAAPNADNWALARQAGVPIICHIGRSRFDKFSVLYQLIKA